jgi:DNA-binding NtrC family response regulator
MPKNVLIIGSNVATRDSLTLTLSQTGHELRVAGNLAESMKIIWAKAPDVIIVDLDVPDVDLKNFAFEAKRMNNQVCVVALAGNGQIPAHLRQHADHVLDTPFTEIDVLRIMQECLSGHKGQRPDEKNYLA